MTPSWRGSEPRELAQEIADDLWSALEQIEACWKIYRGGPTREGDGDSAGAGGGTVGGVGGGVTQTTAGGRGEV